LINWDWIIKLKINETSIKKSITKIKKNKNQSWNINKKKPQAKIFMRTKRKTKSL